MTMMHQTLPAFAKPLGLLLVCGLLSACGKKEEETPPPEEVPVESAELPTPDSGDEAKNEPKVEAQADATAGEGEGAVAERPGRRGDRRRPLRGGEEGAEGREIKPRLRSVDRPTPMPGADVGADGANPGDPAIAPDPSMPPEPSMPPNPGNPANPAQAELAKGDPVGPADPTHQGNPAHERPAANPEVSGPAPAADKLLPLTTIGEVLKGAKLSPAGPLPGIAVQPGYSSTLYATTNGKGLGISLQVWQDPARRESDDRYRRMRLQYPKPEDVNAMPPAKAFYSYFSEVQSLTFVDSVKRVVASVSCGEGLCSHEQLLKLARSVRDRL